MLNLADFREVAALLVFLVLMLFLFPAQVGSFQATHGPTATLKELSLKLFVQALVALLSAILLTNLVTPCCVGVTSRRIFSGAKLSDTQIFSLRC